MKNGLLEFRVSNFASIKDEMVLSMEAGPKEELEENVIEVKDDKILKTVAILGANASGKSNLIKAFTSAILFIRNSSNLQVGSPILWMVPFKFDEKSKDKPCSFDFTFIANGVKYNYGFTADTHKVHSEYLQIFNSAKPSLIFKKTNTSDYIFGPNCKKSLTNAFNERNLPNKLMLSTATLFNFSETKNPYLWFANSINTFLIFDIGLFSDEALNKASDGEAKDFLLSTLKSADISIDDYDIKVVHRALNNIEKAALPFKESLLNDAREIRITTHHKIGGVKYSLTFEEESQGSIKMFCLGILLKGILSSGATMIIDEIEKDLHPMLVEHLVGLFNSPCTNPYNAQLIFTTHSKPLLNLNLLRRDQIYFVQKDSETGASELFSLDDFPVRKDENIEKAYTNGRYGAIPVLKD